MRLVVYVIAALSLFLPTATAWSVEVRATPWPGAFPLVDGRGPAPVLVDEQDAQVVTAVAGPRFADDIQRVTGQHPEVREAAHWDGRPAVIVGTLGQSRLIDQLVGAGRLDVSDLKGKWEAFKVVVLRRGGDARALVIIGSDRRGTAYGVFEVSQAIGVSPWSWWADVPAKHRSALYVHSDGDRIGPPTVKYRGIFLNDEDWGLQPWAAKTYEPKTGDIGPKTYAAIFELLLRLKANYVWPAMHPSTHAFNHYPDDKRVADKYAIVMGSSHAEPMLRNNVDEWDEKSMGDFDFTTNRQRVLHYWDQRIAENGRYENVYTIGMRGVHDSGMHGGKTLEDKAHILEQIFTAQRDILEKHIGKPADRIPQLFVPYKEVLPIYRAGLHVPPDVTLGWVDDNHGYIRQLSNARERQRPGGSGVYYHLSYWGRPHDYLWLNTTPPGLAWEEMTKSLAYGADRLWVVNVGDLKPAEIGIDWFLQLGWDADRYGPADSHKFLVQFFGQNFGDKYADDIAGVMSDYYRLNFPRKPEHMGWNRISPYTPVQNGELSHWAHGDEAQRRLDAFDDLQARAEAINKKLPADARDAYFELVLYPVLGAADMNRKMIEAETSRLLARHGWPAANHDAELAKQAYQRIQDITHKYNNQIADGKWRGIMPDAPRGLKVFGMPEVGTVQARGEPGLAIRIEGKGVPARAVGDAPQSQAATPIRLDLGAARPQGALHRVDTPQGPAITLPQNGDDRIQKADGPARVTLDFSVPRAGRYTLRVQANHPSVNDDSWYFQLDDDAATTWNNHATSGAWRGYDVERSTLEAGRHRLTVIAREDGAKLRRIELTPSQAAAATRSPALTEQPNQLPTVNRYTHRRAFIDLYNTGAGDVRWTAQADQPWVRFSDAHGRFDAHQRIEVGIDFAKAPPADRLTANLKLHGAGKTYRLTLPIRNPADDLSPGTFIRENNAISINAQHFKTSHPGAGGSRWRIITGVGYSGKVVGLVPRLLPEGVELQAGRTAPSLSYPLYVFKGGPATLTLQALPTHTINRDHELICAVAIDDGPPQRVHFAQGNDEHNPTWQRNILRGAMTSSVQLQVPAGSHMLTVFGLDPSVVLDRMDLVFAPIAPTYLGPRETRVTAPRSP